MKEPIDIGRGLKYPKNLFTKKVVLREKSGMGTPEAWKFSEDEDNYFLIFSEKTYDEKHPIKHPRKLHKDTSSFSKGYWMEDEQIPSFLR